MHMIFQNVAGMPSLFFSGLSAFDDVEHETERVLEVAASRVWRWLDVLASRFDKMALRGFIIRHIKGRDERVRSIVPVDPKMKGTRIEVQLGIRARDQAKAEHARIEQFDSGEIRNVDGDVMIGSKGNGGFCARCWGDIRLSPQGALRKGTVKNTTAA